ncbi:MAG TPA: hypothetical protein VFP59_20390 [Candidatus Angelobacter sp.]|nr:hypothetical protein [Candidatus Angelobacter sp.]
MAIPLVWIPVALMIGAVAYLIGELLCRFPARTITEVEQFVREVRLDDLMPHLHPRIDDVLRDSFPRAQLREAQLRRLHFIREYLQRMSHNSLVLIQLSNTEMWRESVGLSGMEDSEQFMQLASDLHNAAVEFRLYALCTLIRIQLWMVFRANPWSPLSCPNIPDLKEIFGFKFTESYLQLKEAAGELFLAYGQEFYDCIMSKI